MTEWLNKNLVFRRVVLLITIFLTAAVSVWSMWFCMDNLARSGSDLAMIVGAVQLPITMLAKAVYDAYVKGRSE